MTDEWINRIWHMHAMEHYLASKRNNILLHASTCMNLEKFFFQNGAGGGRNPMTEGSTEHWKWDSETQDTRSGCKDILSHVLRWGWGLGERQRKLSRKEKVKEWERESALKQRSGDQNGALLEGRAKYRGRNKDCQVWFFKWALSLGLCFGRRVVSMFNCCGAYGACFWDLHPLRSGQLALWGFLSTLRVERHHSESVLPKLDSFLTQFW